MTGKEIGGPILSDHQEESSRVMQEAHWQQQVTDSARRTLYLAQYFHFYLFVFVLLSVRRFNATFYRDARSS